jgi:WD40 repeat protein
MSTVIFLSRRPLLSLRLLFIYAARSGLALIATYIQSHRIRNDIDATSCRLVIRLLGVAATSAGPSRMSSDVPRSSRAKRPLRPFKKDMPVSLSESASHPASSGGALRRAAECRSLRASVRKHYTLLTRCVKHFGSSLPVRGLRVLALCTSSSEGVRRVFDIVSLAEQAQVNISPGFYIPCAIASSSDGDLIASGTASGAVQV